MARTTPPQGDVLELAAQDSLQDHPHAAGGRDGLGTVVVSPDMSVRSTDADAFFLAFNQLVLSERWTIEAISPADETVEAVYRHLIVQEQVAT